MTARAECAICAGAGEISLDHPDVPEEKVAAVVERTRELMAR